MYQRYDKLFPWILSPQNLSRAAQAVIRKGGQAGLDGMTVEQLNPWLRDHQGELCEKIKTGAWRPSPLRPGRHLLLVPTALDRFVQQAIFQVLEPIFGKDFSPASFGCPPGRTRDQERALGREYRQAGYGYVLKPFLENFIDRVDHGILLRQIRKRIRDEAVLETLARILRPAEEALAGGAARDGRGLRQTGNLSALFCGIYLSGHDRFLEKNGLRFTRFVDRYSIYLKTRSGAEQALALASGYLEGKLALPVNRGKSVVEGP